jgi:hypothetical protein
VGSVEWSLGISYGGELARSLCGAHFDYLPVGLGDSRITKNLSGRCRETMGEFSLGLRDVKMEDKIILPLLSARHSASRPSN